MTPEAQRIAIAEACGWKWYRWGRGGGLHLLTPHHDWSGGSMVPCERVVGEEFRADSWPDYLNDLNAMHEAALSLDIVSKRVFSEKLREVCDDELPGDVLGDEFVIQNATAAQRARAFLETLGLWDNGSADICGSDAMIPSCLTKLLKI